MEIESNELRGGRPCTACLEGYSTACTCRGDEPPRAVAG